MLGVPNQFEREQLQKESLIGDPNLSVLMSGTPKFPRCFNCDEMGPEFKLFGFYYVHATKETFCEDLLA